MRNTKSGETVKTVSQSYRMFFTQLKQGVNERASLAKLLLQAGFILLKLAKITTVATLFGPGLTTLKLRSHEVSTTARYRAVPRGGTDLMSRDKCDGGQVLTGTRDGTDLLHRTSISATMRPQTPSTKLLEFARNRTS